jgi:hypothetical protein
MKLRQPPNIRVPEDAGHALRIDSARRSLSKPQGNVQSAQQSATAQALIALYQLLDERLPRPAEPRP